MDDLNKKAFGGLFFLLLVISASLFISAWTFNYWQAWVFLAVFGCSVLVITLYLMKKDPKLLARRVQAGPIAEKETIQKIIQAIAGVDFVAIFVLSASDHRFAWSMSSLPVVIMGNILVMLGLYIVFLVFKENTFTSATIEVAPDLKVTTSGPYAIVRHPMYSGAFVMLIGVPLALGSLWGTLAIIPIVIVIVIRLFNEEKILSGNLAGYKEYCQKVRWRLIPFVF